MARFSRLASLAAALLLPLAAQARNTEVFVSAESATRSERARGYLLDVPFYLKGQPGAPNGKPLSKMTTQQATSGAFRSDQSSCRVAFLTALRELQKEAQRVGGDAVVDIVSVTRDVRSESPTDFRCIAGAMVVHVALEGTVVDLE
jgi:uncharacterized protein YbjQ (UPF0145 family)